MLYEVITGRHCYEVSHHSSQPCSRHGETCPLETVFDTGLSTQVMHVHLDRQDREEYVQINAAPLTDGNGRVLYMGEQLSHLRITSYNVCYTKLLRLILELQASAAAAGLHLHHPQCAGLLAQGGEAEEVLHLGGQQAEAVDHLHLQVAQVLVAARAGDALVQRQPRMHVGQIVVRDQCRQVQLSYNFV